MPVSQRREGASAKVLEVAGLDPIGASWLPLKYKDIMINLHCDGVDIEQVSCFQTCIVSVNGLVDISILFRWETQSISRNF
jgi:hypothetical protein